MGDEAILSSLVYEVKSELSCQSSKSDRDYEALKRELARELLDEEKAIILFDDKWESVGEDPTPQEAMNLENFINPFNQWEGGNASNSG